MSRSPLSPTEKYRYPSASNTMREPKCTPFLVSGIALYSSFTSDNAFPVSIAVYKPVFPPEASSLAVAMVK